MEGTGSGRHKAEERWRGRQEDLMQALRELSQENDPNFKIEIEENPDEPEQ